MRPTSGAGIDLPLALVLGKSLVRPSAKMGTLPRLPTYQTRLAAVFAAVLLLLVAPAPMLLFVGFIDALAIDGKISAR